MKYRPPKLIQTPPARTKIDERREREEYDRSHPWQPMGTAIINDGVVCELLFSDMASISARYFLGEDDHWYQIDPPKRLSKQAFLQRTPMNWRPTNRKLSPDKRTEIMRRGNRNLFINGRWVEDSGW